MKELEDRIKDRLEDYESSLPEGDLAEFKALLEASATAGTKRSPAYLAWLAPVAVAAGLALFFVLRPGPQQEIMPVVEGGSLLAEVVETPPADANDLAEPEPVEDATSVNAIPAGERRAKRPDTAAAVKEETENKEIASAISEHSASDQAGNSGRTEQKVEDKRKDDGSPVNSSAGYSPFVPSGSYGRKTVSMKVGQAAAGVIGGTGVIVLAGALPALVINADYEPGYGEFSDLGGIYTDQKPPVDRRTYNETHHLPLRTSLSYRIPFTDRWSLTTGLDYSWYASRLEYSLSGIHNQSAHYLEIPLRADLTIARNRWMDVYVGAGGSVDFCVAAFDAGQKTARDGAGFSLIGAGGIQFNISKNLGLFLDPTLSWDMTSGNRTLDTYRSEHPFMLTVSTGLRFSVPTK